MEWTRLWIKASILPDFPSSLTYRKCSNWSTGNLSLNTCFVCQLLSSTYPCSPLMQFSLCYYPSNYLFTSSTAYGLPDYFFPFRERLGVRAPFFAIYFVSWMEQMVSLNAHLVVDYCSARTGVCQGNACPDVPFLSGKCALSFEIKKNLLINQS